MEGSPFHAGELRAQELAGASARGAGIRSFMPDQHRSFFELLPYLFVATLDAEGWPVATVFSGEPGFVRSPDANTLEIAAAPASDDPAAAGFHEGRPVGLLGLDLSTRRRNRANGFLARVNSGDATVTVAQSFGNCPQYIQQRLVRAAATSAKPAEPLASLDEAARAMIGGADTLFVASMAPGADGGLDISHRGGRPGFVRVDGDTLTIPDFSGNRYFNTLGNLVVEPRAGLAFVDFESGDVLQLQGLTEVLWDSEEARRIEGAERLWRFKVVRGVRRRAALPLRWSFESYAPTTARTGTWRSAA